MRAKWSAPIRKYWKISEQMMVKYCDLAICDSVNLPILPVEWKLLVHNTKKPQFNVLRKLLRSKKFNYVVNACDHQMNMFEDFIGYQGSAVLDEPVREEDSFSKESMPQESEISENILLPDLAKQSESIEQQSGEIAERGMPT